MNNHRICRYLIVVLYFLIILITYSGSQLCTNKVENYQSLLDSYRKEKEYIRNHLARGENPLISFPKESALLHNSDRQKGIPIPLYHCINDHIWGYKSMFVSPANFEAQMKYLKEQGYTPITFQDFKRIQNIKKPTLITFDDGYEDNYFNAYPILKKYGFKATIFLIDKTIDKKNYLKRSQIKQMQDIIDFQSHTMTHPHLAKLKPDQIEYELSTSKKNLELLLQKKIQVIAYPYGSYDDRVTAIARNFYNWGVTTHAGKYYEFSGDAYQINRMIIFNQTTFSEFMEFFK